MVVTLSAKNLEASKDEGMGKVSLYFPPRIIVQAWGISNKFLSGTKPETIFGTGGEVLLQLDLADG